MKKEIIYGLFLLKADLKEGGKSGVSEGEMNPFCGGICFPRKTCLYTGQKQPSHISFLNMC